MLEFLRVGINPPQRVWVAGTRGFVSLGYLGFNKIAQFVFFRLDRDVSQLLRIDLTSNSAKKAVEEALMTTVEKASPDTSVDWLNLVLGANGEGINLIECLSRRRFNSDVLADEAATFVLGRLSENNWQRCHQFKGGSHPKTFLQRLIINLLEEFSRKRFGRLRPPAWLIKQGELWMKLWKELCLERQTLPALLHRYTQSGLYELEWVRHASKVIKARIPRCGEPRFEAAAVEDIATLESQAGTIAQHISDDIATPCQTQGDNCGYDIELKMETELLLMLRAVMQEEPSVDEFGTELVKKLDSEASAARQKLEKLRQSLTMTDEEKIMLKMVYSDGLSKAAVSKALGLPRHRTGLVIKDVLQRIQKAIDFCELDLFSLLGKT